MFLLSVLKRATRAMYPLAVHEGDNETLAVQSLDGDSSGWETERRWPSVPADSCCAHSAAVSLNVGRPGPGSKVVLSRAAPSNGGPRAGGRRPCRHSLDRRKAIPPRKGGLHRRCFKLPRLPFLFFFSLLLSCGVLFY